MPSPFDLLHSLCTTYNGYILKMCTSTFIFICETKLYSELYEQAFYLHIFSSRTFERCVGWGTFFFFMVQHCPMLHLLISPIANLSEFPQTPTLWPKIAPTDSLNTLQGVRYGPYYEMSSKPTWGLKHSRWVALGCFTVRRIVGTKAFKDVQGVQDFGHKNHHMEFLPLVSSIPQSSVVLKTCFHCSAPGWEAARGMSMCGLSVSLCMLSCSAMSDSLRPQGL